MVNSYRATLIKQAIQKGYDLDPQITQNLGKVKIKKVDNKECNCDITGCFLYKVETTIPKYIRLNYVGSTGGQKFDSSTYQAISIMQHSKYTGKVNRYFTLDQELYIVSPNHNLGKYINIQGVFEDPKATNQYKTCECDNEESCYDGFDFEYPMPSAMLDTIKKMVMDAELRFADHHKSDQITNSKEDNAELK